MENLPFLKEVEEGAGEVGEDAEEAGFEFSGRTFGGLSASTRMALESQW